MENRHLSPMRNDNNLRKSLCCLCPGVAYAPTFTVLYPTFTASGKSTPVHVTGILFT